MAPDMPAHTSKVEILNTFLEGHPAVKVINVQWVDLVGVVRSRIVPVPSFIHMIETRGYLGGSPADLVFPVDQEILPRLLDVVCLKGKVIPDLSSLRAAPHDSAKFGNAAVVYANIEEEDHGLDFDARDILARTVEGAEKEAGLKFLVGFELEFVLIEKDKKTFPSPNSVLSMAVANVTNRSRFWPFLNQCAVALTEAGIHVEQIIKEYSATQFEFALPPLPPLQAVDACIYAKETIRDIAYQHNMLATFYPSHGDESMASGQHIHISASPFTSKAKNFDPETFLGGLLSHIPALCAIGMPSHDSYVRTEAGHLGSGAYVGYGTNHRDMPVRLVTKDHWEVRANDGTANPYMMVSAIIAAGLDAKPLTHKDCSSKYLSPLGTRRKTSTRC